MGLPIRDRATLGHRYTLHHGLGERRFGQRWLAEDAVTDEAVDVLALSDRFRSLRALTSLRDFEQRPPLEHPGVAALHGVAVDEDGRPHLITATTAGEWLDGRLAREPGGAWLSCRALVLAVGETLVHAHDRGWLHGALTPTAIMLEHGEPRRPRLTVHDFGLAEIADAGDPERRWRSRADDVAYMAPELLAGAAVHVGADVYALGVLLWELVAGRRPFKATRLPLFDAERRRASLLGRDCPSELDALLELALAPAPEDRFADAHEFLDTLQALDEGRDDGDDDGRDDGDDDGRDDGRADGPLTAELLSTLSGLEPAALRLVRRHVDALLR